MSSSSRALAKKYATAYQHCFKSTEQEIYTLKQAAADLVRHKEALFLLTVASIKKEEKKQLLKKMVIETYQLPESIKQLTDLVVEHKRLELLPDIFEAIITVYNEQHNRIEVTVISSHVIQENDRAVIKKFLSSATKQVIVYDYKIDKQLIMGLRLQSNTFLWEHSIQKDIRRIRQSLMFE